MTDVLYSNYLSIDQDYFPVVNNDIMNKVPDMWKKFYPHETFIRFIKTMIGVMERKQKLCVWVEGSYGTGKSHAVLTFKKLLEASEAETRDYFEKHKLQRDAYNRLQSLKNGNRILAVHRYGSSDIHEDRDLVFAVQESIVHAFAEAGIEMQGKSGLKNAVIHWLSDADNKSYFNRLIQNKYKLLFKGDDVDTVLKKLNEYTDDSLNMLMDNIFKVADEIGIRAMKLDTHDLCDWIREIIEQNQLGSIVFIWDEFTEYLKNNRSNLTGFQQLCELSATLPFYFVIVTHASQSLFKENDPDYKKLNDRFVSPHCEITLPENIAFQLMDAAIGKPDNRVPEKRRDWLRYIDDLSKRTQGTRSMIEKAINIENKYLSEILPIHPYTALCLKYISSAFDSSQRSMFDFMKNDRGDEILGFKWFTEHYGPFSANPLLSVDMLWGFFYEKGKDTLSNDIRSILDYATRPECQNLADDQKRVLKTILLLQALSLNAGTAVKLCIPNESNIRNIFQGTDLEGSCDNCIKSLIRDHIIFEKPLGGNEMQYAPYSYENNIDLTKYEAKVDKDPTTKWVQLPLGGDDSISRFLIFNHSALKLRYSEIKHVSLSDFDTAVRQLRASEGKVWSIPAVVCYAKDDNEVSALRLKMQHALTNDTPIVFIDTTPTPFGKSEYETFRRDMALADSQQGKDSTLVKQYTLNAHSTLKQWKQRISNGSFNVYSKEYTNGTRAATMDALCDTLLEIDSRRYPDSFEANHYKVIDNMYKPSALRQGVEAAISGQLTGTYRSANINTKLETALNGAWAIPEYWIQTPNLLISRIKIALDEMIQQQFKDSGRISIQCIYDTLKSAPYGMMPCNLTAFMMGFVLKEYTQCEYSWSDNINSAPLDAEKLSEMIASVLSNETSPKHTKEQYIVAVTPEERAFNEISSTSFHFPIESCTTLTDTRELIRNQMKKLSFPIWTLKFILKKTTTQTDKKKLEKLIDDFYVFCNTNNAKSSESETDIALRIGKCALKNPKAKDDLKALFCNENCTEGMNAYLKTFENGRLLQLSKSVGDNGKYIDALGKKFKVDAANWVWNTDTADQAIRDIILDYEIMEESNRIIERNTTFADTIKAWMTKCDNIRIACDAMQNEMDDLSVFLGKLCSMKRTDSLPDGQKQEFLGLLRQHGEQFSSFYNNQIETFKRVCGYLFKSYDESDIETIFSKVPLSGAFTRSKSEYIQRVEEIVRKYAENQKSAQLQKLWQEKTGSSSPKAWSNQHQMPILCLIPDDEISKARETFDVINNERSDEKSVDNALDYLSHATFFDTIRDEHVLDEIFKERIIKGYDVMLSNIQEVKNRLLTEVSREPYEWFGRTDVDRIIKEMANEYYTKEGAQKAMDKIDHMDIVDVKKYLKTLIRTSMTVGLEIIKSK